MLEPLPLVGKRRKDSASSCRFHLRVNIGETGRLVTTVLLGTCTFSSTPSKADPKVPPGLCILIQPLWFAATRGQFGQAEPRMIEQKF
ncbi:hypothetical protein ABIF79_009954 [Bradyrhizobium japonicum]